MDLLVQVVDQQHTVVNKSQLKECLQFCVSISNDSNKKQKPLNDVKLTLMLNTKNSLICPLIPQKRSSGKWIPEPILRQLVLTSHAAKGKEELSDNLQNIFIVCLEWLITLELLLIMVTIPISYFMFQQINGTAAMIICSLGPLKKQYSRMENKHIYYFM